jgi:hypothetical protein
VGSCSEMRLVFEEEGDVVRGLSSRPPRERDFGPREAGFVSNGKTRELREVIERGRVDSEGLRRPGFWVKLEGIWIVGEVARRAVWVDGGMYGSCEEEEFNECSFEELEDESFKMFMEADLIPGLRRKSASSLRDFGRLEDGS